MNSTFTLNVLIESAEKLPVADITTSDPYAVVQLKDVIIGRTKTVKRHTNPVWNEAYQIGISYLDQFLILKIFDTDVGKDDDLMGEVKIHISTIPIDSQPVKTSYRVVGVGEFSHHLIATLQVTISLSSNPLVKIIEYVDPSLFILRVAPNDYHAEILNKANQLIQAHRVASADTRNDESDWMVERSTYLSQLHDFFIDQIQRLCFYHETKAIAEKLFQLYLIEAISSLNHTISLLNPFEQPSLFLHKFSRVLDQFNTAASKVERARALLSREILPHGVRWEIFTIRSDHSLLPFDQLLLKDYIDCESVLHTFLMHYIQSQKKKVTLKCQAYFSSFSSQKAGNLRSFYFPKNLIFEELQPSLLITEKLNQLVEFKLALAYYTLLVEVGQLYLQHLSSIKITPFIARAANGDRTTETDTFRRYNERSAFDGLLSACVHDSRFLQTESNFRYSLNYDTLPSDVVEQFQILFDTSVKSVKSIFHKVEEYSLQIISHQIVSDSFDRYQTFYAHSEFTQLISEYLQIVRTSDWGERSHPKNGLLNFIFQHHVLERLSCLQRWKNFLSVEEDELEETEARVAEKYEGHEKIHANPPLAAFVILKLTLIKKFMLIYYELIYSFHYHTSINCSSAFISQKDEITKLLHEDGQNLSRTFYLFVTDIPENDVSSVFLDVFSHFIALLSTNYHCTVPSLNCLNILQTDALDDDGIVPVRKAIEVFLGFHQKINKSVLVANPIHSDAHLDRKDSVERTEKRKSSLFGFVRNNSDRIKASLPSEVVFPKSTATVSADPPPLFIAEIDEVEEDIIQIVALLAQFTRIHSRNSTPRDGSSASTTTDADVFIAQTSSFFSEVSRIFEQDPCAFEENSLKLTVERPVFSDPSDSIAFPKIYIHLHDILIYHLFYFAGLFTNERPTPYLVVEITGNQYTSAPGEVFYHHETHEALNIEEIRADKIARFNDPIDIDVFGDLQKKKIALYPNQLFHLSIRLYYKPSQQIGEIVLPFTAYQVSAIAQKLSKPFTVPEIASDKIVAAKSKAISEFRPFPTLVTHIQVASQFN